MRRRIKFSELLWTLAVLCLSTQLSYAKATSATQKAVTDLLGRELPRAIETHSVKSLLPYFATDVTMKWNVEGADIVGPDGVYLSYDWPKFQPIIDHVLVSENAVVLVMNFPSEGISDPQSHELKPRVDTFHVDANGKISRVDVIIAERVFHPTQRGVH